MTIDVSPEGLYFPTDITPEQLFKAMGKLRRAAMEEIERLLNFLDSTEPDPDAEPSLGWPYSPYDPTQTGPDFCANADAGSDLEDDGHDLEPDTHNEPSLGWTDMEASCGQYAAPLHGGIDLEDEHNGEEPDVDNERTLGWANEGRQNFGAEGLYPECEGTSPEWPSSPAKVPRPKRRTVAKSLPTISMKECERVPA